MECGELCEIETIIDLMVQLKEGLETPHYYILK